MVSPGEPPPPPEIRHWLAEGGATPRGVDAAVRRAAGAVIGSPPEELPPADPRRVPTGEPGDYISPLPARLSGAASRRGGSLAADIAAELRADPWVTEAVARPSGFVVLTLTPAARLSLVTAASTRWDYLAGSVGPARGTAPSRPTGPAGGAGPREGRAAGASATPAGGLAVPAGGDPSRRYAGAEERPSVPGAAAPPEQPPGPPSPDGLEGRAELGECSPLERAATIAEARGLARADAMARVARFLAAAVEDQHDRLGADQRPPVGEAARREVSWRDPYMDAPPGGGEVARLLAAVGEAGVRVALCRSASRPRPGEVTGPDLPALPTADRPGAWARNTGANPAFVLRHAHAHAHTTVFRWARDLGFSPLTVASPPPAAGAGGAVLPLSPLSGSLFPSSPAAALDTDGASAVVGALFDGPGLVAAASRRGQPHTLVRYLEGLAAAYHEWRYSCDVLPAAGGDGGGNGFVTAARLELCDAVRETLATGLLLLGVAAPTRL